MAAIIGKRARYIFEESSKTTDIAIKCSDEAVIHTFKSLLIINFDVYNSLFNGEWEDSDNNKITVSLDKTGMTFVLDWCNTKAFDCTEHLNLIHDIVMFAHEKGCTDLEEYCKTYVKTNMAKIILNKEAAEPIMVNKSFYGIEIEKDMKKVINTNLQPAIDELVYKDMKICLIILYFETWPNILEAVKKYISLGDLKEQTDKFIRYISTWSYSDVDITTFKKLLAILDNASENHNHIVLVTKIAKKIAGMPQ